MCHKLGVRCQMSGVTCQVSCVRCQLSVVKCQVSSVIFIFDSFLDKVLGLVGAGSVINRA